MKEFVSCLLQLTLNSNTLNKISEKRFEFAEYFIDSHFKSVILLSQSDIKLYLMKYNNNRTVRLFLFYQENKNQKYWKQIKLAIGNLKRYSTNFP